MFFLDAHHSQQKSTSRSRCNLVPKSPPPGVVGAWAHPLWKMMEFVSWNNEIPNTKNDSYLFPIWVYFHVYIYILYGKKKHVPNHHICTPWIKLIGCNAKEKTRGSFGSSQTWFFKQLQRPRFVGEISDSSPRWSKSSTTHLGSSAETPRAECWIQPQLERTAVDVMEMSWKYATFTATSHFVICQENLWIIVCHSHMSTTKIKSLVQARK